MGILKFASKESKRIDLGEGDFIEVRSDLSKREFNALMTAMPNRELSEESGLTLAEGLAFAEELFDALVTGWSLPEEPSRDNYLNLSQEASAAIDAKLVEHFGEISPSKEESSKAPTSRGSRRREPLPRI